MAVEGRGEELKKFERERKRGGNGKGEEMKEVETRRPVRDRKVVESFLFQGSGKKRRNDDLLENGMHTDKSEDEDEDLDDTLPEEEGNQVRDSPSKKRKAAHEKKNSTSKSVTKRGKNGSEPSTSTNGQTGKRKALMARAQPSDQQILAVVSDMLRTVDFDYASLNDILKELEAHFYTDLSHIKDDLRSIIEEAIYNMTDTDTEEEEEEEEEDEEEDY